MKSVQKVIQSLIAAPFKQSRGNRTSLSQDITDTYEYVQTELLSIMKKLMRGDFIGASHFAREVGLVWKTSRNRCENNPESINLIDSHEQMFNTMYQNNNVINAKLRDAALIRPKLETRKRRGPRRKGSDHLGSKKTTETETPNFIEFDRQHMESELNKKLRNMEPEEVKEVWRILIKHNEIEVFETPIKSIEDLNLHSISSTALQELTKYSKRRGKVLKPTSRARCSRPAKTKPTIAITSIPDSSNSSFLTGSHVLKQILIENRFGMGLFALYTLPFDQF